MPHKSKRTGWNAMRKQNLFVLKHKRKQKRENDKMLKSRGLDPVYEKMMKGSKKSLYDPYPPSSGTNTTSQVQNFPKQEEPIWDEKMAERIAGEKRDSRNGNTSNQE